MCTTFTDTHANTQTQVEDDMGGWLGGGGSGKVKMRVGSNYGDKGDYNEWTMTVVVETMQCTVDKDIESCPAGEQQGYTATVDFLVKIVSPDQPGAFSATQPRPYFNPSVVRV